MSGIQFQKKLRADSDFGLLTYPIATTNSTITVRTDVLQKQPAAEEGGAPTFTQVFSTNNLIAARQKDNDKKAILPPIDLEFADDEE